MAVAARHIVAWQAPRPLWRGSSYGQAPQILRFASDDFMERLIAALEEDPASISGLVARPETWRTPTAALPEPDLIQRVAIPAPVAEAKRRRLLGSSRPVPPPPSPPKPLKLYQPAHMRHYVVAGSLACALPGLPERVLGGPHETVGFVVRRILPEGPQQRLREFAYVKEGSDARWRLVADGAGRQDVLAAGEEMLPLFRLSHRDEQGRPRGLWGGIVPVGRREDYLSKRVVRQALSLSTGQRETISPAPAAMPPPSKMARVAKLRVDVIEPWKDVVRAAMAEADKLRQPGAVADQEAKALRFAHNVQFQMQSWLILLDLADFLETHVTPVWQRISSASPTGLSGHERALHQALEAARSDDLAIAMLDPDPQGKPAQIRAMRGTLRAALAEIQGSRDALEQMAHHYTPETAAAREQGWPNFHFPLSGVTHANGLGGACTHFLAMANPQGFAEDDPQPIVDSPGAAEGLDKLTALIGLAMAARVEDDVEQVPFAMQLRDAMTDTVGDEGLFAIRFVHLNRDCGPLHPPMVSAPTQDFRLASFFDSDAPVRPLRISLPMDTSPAGLRKHGRGTAFVLSDMLCGQVQRAKGLGLVDLVRHVLPPPLHKKLKLGSGGGCKGPGGAPDIGMICSLSIPIVTICALILLTIIVSLLDFIFRWLPWFAMCFPVPGLKGKK